MNRSGEPPSMQRSYFDRVPLPWSVGDDSGNDYPLTIGDLKMLLSAVEGELERHKERERGGKGVVVEA